MNGCCAMRLYRFARFVSVFAHGVHQHEHEILQMINGAIVVVVILQKSVGVHQHGGHVVIAQQTPAFQLGYQKPSALIHVKVIN